MDLLLAGALKKENLVQYYLGTVARKILRRAECSVLLLTNPSIQPAAFRNIVVNAENSPFVEDAIVTACHIGRMDQSSWLHVVRELKMYGLTMSVSEEYSEKEYDSVRQNLVKVEIDNVEKILQGIPHGGLKVNIKWVSGKSGFELSKFAERKQADLLVVGAPPQRFSFLKSDEKMESLAFNQDASLSPNTHPFPPDSFRPSSFHLVMILFPGIEISG